MSSCDSGDAETADAHVLTMTHQRPSGLSAHALIAWAVACPILLVLTAPPVGLWPAVFLLSIPPFVIGMNRGRRRWPVVALWLGSAMGWWTLESWMSDVTTPGWVAMGGYLAIYTTLPAILIGPLRRAPGFRRLPMAILVPMVIVAVEFLRARVILGGYQLTLLGTLAADVPVLLQVADLGSVWLVSGVIAAVSGGLIDLWLGGGRTPRTGAWGPLVAAGVLALTVVYGWWRLAQSEPLSPGPTVLLVQTNVPQDNKIGWTPQRQAEDIPVFLRETVQGLTDHGGDVDLVVWPETMVPGVGFDGDTAEVIIANPGFQWVRQWPIAVSSLATASGTSMLVGSETWIDVTIEDRDDARWLRHGAIYNSAVLIDPDGTTTRADKVFLQPFGERLPWVDAWPWLADQVLGLAPGGLAFALTPATSTTVLHLLWNGEDVAFGAPICIEDAAPWVCREMVYDQGVKRVAFLANLSNDGWFGQSLGGRQRHVQAAQLRAIENRVPLVRASNTGMSVSIDSVGRVVASVGGPEVYNVAGHLVTSITRDSRTTIAGWLVGGSVGWACLLLTVGGVMGARWAAGSP